MTNVILLGVFIGLGLFSTLTGRTVAAALGPGLLYRFTPTTGAASAILGSGLLIFSSSALSCFGLTARHTLVAILLLLGATLAVACARGTLRAFLPEGHPTTCAGLHGALLVCVVVALLPILRENGFSATNDTVTYCSLADWFLRNAYSTPAGPDPLHPVTDFVSLYQTIGSRLGVSHLLAICAVASGSPTSLLVIQAVSAWGLALTLLGVFLVARWVLRLPTGVGLAGGLAYALLPHPLLWGHHNGFLQQAFGGANVLLAVAVLTRAAHRSKWKMSTGFLVGLVVVCQCYAYLQMLPFLVMGALWPAWAAAGAGRRHGARGLLGLLLMATAVTLAGATSYLADMLLRFESMVTGVAGREVILSTREFFAFGMGTRVLRPFHAFGGEPAEGLPLAAGLLALLAAIGLGAGLRRSRWGGALGVVFAFVALVVYFSLFSVSPWSGERGHTFNVFKAVQWAFPWVFLLGMAGASRVVRVCGCRTGLLLWLVALAPAIGIPEQWAAAHSYGQSLGSLLQVDRPLEALPALERRLASLPPGALVILNRPARHGSWLGTLVALVAYPRPIIGNWNDTVWISPRPRLHAEWMNRIRDGVATPILIGPPAFASTSVERLGGPLYQVLDPEPFVTEFGGRSNQQKEPVNGAEHTSLGLERTRIVVFSRTSRSLSLEIRLAPDEPRPGPQLVSVFPGNLAGRALRDRLAEEPQERPAPDSLCFPVDLYPGLTTVVLRPTHPDSQPSARIRDIVLVSLGTCTGP